MEPSTTPITLPTDPYCVTCDGPLNGNKLRCPDCVRAAETAVREARGNVVLPSDIDRVRNR